MSSHDPFSAERSRPGLPPPEPLDGRRPRVLAHVLRAFPMHFAGAERMLHDVLDGLVARGWDAHIVAVEHKGPPYQWNGITVQALRDDEMGAPYAWCDVALTHLDITGHAMAWARYGRPLLHLVHNHRQLAHHRVPADGRNLPVWNSRWVAAEWADWAGPSVVCRPPLTAAGAPSADRHRLRTVTLVNLLGEKGGPLFWRLARRLPDWRFVGVIGAYGYQYIPDPMPPNGVVVRNGGDMSAVWAETSVYLAPSWYESWGLAAAEALCSGIPVVAHPTPGLRESLTHPTLGEVGVFRDRDDDQAWVDAVEQLADRGRWEERSRLALAQAEHLRLQSTADLDRLDAFARAAAADNQHAASETVAG